MQWNDRENRFDERRRERDWNNLISERQHRRVSLFCNRNDARAACTNFLNVRHNLGVQRVGVSRAGHDDENNLARLDERDGTVLQLASRKTFRVDVRKFFELESAFQRNWEADVAAE
ncbi:MAG: hypothetical protein RLZZ587_772 [Actinomycetota bacterium]